MALYRKEVKTNKKEKYSSDTNREIETHSYTFTQT